jgi:acetoacetyl-CoA synthetase
MFSGGAMPQATWFAGARLNYAEHVLARAPRDRPALLAVAEDGEPLPWTTEELRGKVGALSAHLRELGVTPGDRVAAYLPNVPEAVVGMLATTALGAVWSVCGPELGATSVVDRFAQIEPKVLLAVDGYDFAGKHHDRTEVVAELRRRLPSVRTTIIVRSGDVTAPLPPGTLAFDEVVREPHAPVFVAVAADHPLWILFSSGTTGLPKGIVHGHGGILLEHFKALGLCLDLGPRDTFFFVCSTSWMAWNLMIGGLLHGSTIVLASGSPSHPSVDGAFTVAAATRATVFGMGSAYVSGCRKAGAEPQDVMDLSALRLLIPTGSPLPPSGWRWLDERFDARIDSICGGTDVCSVFFCGNPLTPVHLGEISGRALAVKAESWSAEGRPQIGTVGEMVVVEPMPSMPLGLWADEDGTRYRDAYFDLYPGVWRQGDWITVNDRGGVVVSGRSDATLNRGGVRLGSAEIYAVVERAPEVFDALVVGAELEDGEYLLALFVVMAPDAVLDDALRHRLATHLRSELSPRHVPDEVVAIDIVPRTLTGKKLEVPVKRILQGAAAQDVAAAGAVDHPEALEWFATWSAGRSRTMGVG